MRDGTSCRKLENKNVERILEKKETECSRYQVTGGEVPPDGEESSKSTVQWSTDDEVCSQDEEPATWNESR